MTIEEKINNGQLVISVVNSQEEFDRQSNLLINSGYNLKAAFLSDDALGAIFLKGTHDN